MASLTVLAFGAISILSIGRPFLMIGLALLALGSLRHRPALFWPPLAAVVAWNVAFLAVAPWICVATQTIGATAPGGAAGEFTTVCSNLIGISYRGAGNYNPSLEPANQAGFLAALTTFVVVLGMAVLTHRAGPARPNRGDPR